MYIYVLLIMIAAIDVDDCNEVSGSVINAKLSQFEPKGM